MVSIDPERLRQRINADPEFRLLSRYWDCALVLDLGESRLRFEIHRGEVTELASGTDDRPYDIRIAAPEAEWKELLATIPRPGYQAIPSTDRGAFTVEGDRLAMLFPYFGAVRCIVDELRGLVSGPAPQQRVPDVDRKFDSAIGRYVYIRIDGVQYRVYFEEAGSGVPIVLQHTAGADGRQWRHVLENPDFQQKFRMISYDLPYHGKSLPPTGLRWWEQEYKLTKDFLMKTVVELGHALELERPVYMGCSIGGHLAPDLAYYYPDEFRAVIGVNAGIYTPSATTETLESWSHPRVSNLWKAISMLGPMSPVSPEPYRRETVWGYSQGAPPVFTGDIYYYGKDHNLTGLAPSIDTSKVDMYLLTGEYDPLNTPEGTPELARQVRGSKFELMEGVGHFGASENPERFMGFLRPVLDEIYAKSPEAARREAAAPVG
jgi:pimeloyl-ACP methyl ester carboxylesterase